MEEFLSGLAEAIGDMAEDSPLAAIIVGGIVLIGVVIWYFCFHA